MVLLHLLLHVLIYHLLSAKGGPRDTGKTNEEQRRLHEVRPLDTNYIIKSIDKCPDVGYYFTREPAPNSIDPGPCFLCFCHSDHTAICWKRDNRRCNVESFYYHGVGKRDGSILQNKVQRNTRVRRSPGFADIFFRDASRDVFNRNTEDQQCKPYESSFSEDCPPVDWCIGCTVCDCDPNGRWDCHILSFCPEKKKGKKKSDGGPQRKVVKKKPIPKTSTSPAPKTTTTNTKRTKPPVRRSANNKSSPKRLMKAVTPKPNNKNNQKQQKKKPPLRYQKITPKAQNKNTVVIKKNIATHKPIQIKGNKVQKIIKNHENNTVVLAQQVVKKVMAAVKQMVQREMNNVTKMVSGGRSELNNTKTKRVDKKVNKRQSRQKRHAMLTDFYKTDPSSLTTIKENDIHIESTVTPDTTKITPLYSNYLTSNIDSTHRPLFSSIQAESDYYKYIVATENPSVIPLETKQTIDINVVNDTVETTTLRSNAINETKSNEIENTEMNQVQKIINDTAIKNIHCELNKAKNATTYVKRNVTLNSTDNTASNKIDFKSTFIADNSITEPNIILSSTGIPTNTVSEVGLNDIPNTFNYLTDFPPEASDINIFKWQQLKKVKSLGGKSRNVVKLIVNKTESIQENKNKLRSKDIGRITVAKKYNLVKILNRYKCPFLNSIVNDNDTVILKSGKKLSDVSNILDKLLKAYNSTKVIKQSKKPKKFNVIRYLKKIFYNIFRRKNTAGRFSRNHIIETLCEHFGPCTKNVKDKALLRLKLAELDHETMTILKTVKIIKGLLRLLDNLGPRNADPRSQPSLRSDIQKLNSILKLNNTNDFKKPLTQTQLMQIEYIKKNTAYFAESVTKFTILLNQIIGMLTKQDSHDHRIVNKHITRDPFQSLKHLLLKYNLVQNNFMKRMYELLNNYKDESYKKPPVTAVTQDLNNTEQIEILSRNIIKNLRKLKYLAESVKYRGRSKREAKDDAIEYLLMLMEFLLKQNKPLDATPDNDGIDLLIEAIRNAPDIKTIRKKVLDNPPLPAVDTAALRMAGPHSAAEISQSDSEDSPSMSGNPSNELKIEYNEKMDESKDLIDEDQELFNTFKYDRRAGITPKPVADITGDTSHYHKLDENESSKSRNIIETTVSPNLDMEAKFRSDMNSVNPNNIDIFSLNADQGITDSENNYNYNVGNNNNSGKRINNLFNNNVGNGNIFDDTLDTGNIDKNNAIGLFNDNTGTLFDYNTETRNVKSGKHSKNGVIFDDNTVNKNTDLDKHNHNDHNDDTHNKNAENSKKNNNVNELVNEITENINNNIENNNNKINVFNDNAENVNNYNNIPEGNNNYNTMPESVNNYNNVQENGHNANNVPDNVNGYNSIPENGNSYNSISDTANYNNMPQSNNNDTNMPENVNNDNNTPINDNNYNSIPENDSTGKSIIQEIANAVTEESSPIGRVGDIKKFSAVYTGDLDEEVVPLTAVDIESLSTTTEYGEWTKKMKTKPIKKIDLSDSESSDKKSKLEWIVENFGRDDKILEEERDHDGKRNNIDHNVTKMPSTTDSKGNTKSSVKPNDSNMSNDIQEPGKKKDPKINTEEVMLKKQMDLLNSLDYGTERAEFDESDSKDGNTDERYSDTFSAYFV